MAKTIKQAANVARHHFRCFAAEQWAKKPELTAKEIRAKWAKKGKPRLLTPAQLEEVRTTVAKYVSGKINYQTVYMVAPIFTRIKKDRFALSLSKPKKPRAKPTRKTLSVTQLCRMSDEDLANRHKPTPERIDVSEHINELDWMLSETGDTNTLADIRADLRDWLYEVESLLDSGLADEDTTLGEITWGGMYEQKKRGPTKTVYGYVDMATACG